MTPVLELVEYVKANVGPAFCNAIYEDEAGGEYKDEAFADATNAIIYLVADFIDKKGIFNENLNYIFTRKDLEEAISHIMVDLNKSYISL